MAEGLDTDTELSEICTKLWEIDENRCVPGTDYEMNLQGYVTTTREFRKDRAHEHLFESLDEENVFERKTYKTFKALLDNYIIETGEQEVVSSGERKENWTFLYAIMETPVMQEAHKWLAAKDLAPESEYDFRGLLYSLWFKTYSRSREYREFDSCGFEHVFVGETRGHDAIGFHNWIQFYLEEKKGNIDYRGYFRRGTADEEDPRLVTIQFLWKKYVEKPIGSSFIGTSPEFEIALYTLIHLTGKEKVMVDIADYQVELRVHRLGKGIGTAYPISKED